VWQHNYEPISGSLGLSAIVAAIPIIVLFIMLGALRRPAWISAVTALVSALIVSLLAYGMPVQLALASTVYGAAYGMFPIAWIVFASIMLYRIAVDTGKFEIIKDSVGGLTDDRRLQAMFIAFSFGAFIEGAAGFGAPVAVSGAMLAGLGFSPFYAAGICLLANTAPVAFGSIGIPVVTLANVTGLPLLPVSAMVGRLCAMISIFIPGYLIVVMTGPKKALEVLPAIIACGVSFAGMQFYVSNYIGPELTDIMSSLTSSSWWLCSSCGSLPTSFGSKATSRRRSRCRGTRPARSSWPGCRISFLSSSCWPGVSLRSKASSIAGPTA
jgi:lactate permease